LNGGDLESKHFFVGPQSKLADIPAVAGLAAITAAITVNANFTFLPLSMVGISNWPTHARVAIGRKAGPTSFPVRPIGGAFADAG
jgi:hypothetical protein